MPAPAASCSNIAPPPLPCSTPHPPPLHAASASNLTAANATPFNDGAADDVLGLLSLALGGGARRELDDKLWVLLCMLRYIVMCCSGLPLC